MAGTKANPTSWRPGKSGNPAGRPRDIERMTREQIATFTWEDEELGTLTGWDALRRRAWLLAMHSDAKDAIRYMQWLDARAHGQPKQPLEVSDAPSEPQVDWSKIPVERRKELIAAMQELELYAADESVEH